MGRITTLLLGLLILLGSAPIAFAQSPITATSTVSLQPELPRRLLFTLEASSSAGELTEARLFFRTAGAAVRNSEPIRFDPAPTVTLSHEWEIQQDSIPPGATIEYFWQLKDSAGNTLETPKQSFLALDPRYEWQTLEDNELAIHWYDGDQEWGHEMFETGKQALAKLQNELGTEIEEQVRLVAYADREAYRSAFAPWVQDSIGSAYYSSRVTVQILPAGDREMMRSLLFHELSHLVLDQALRGSLATIPSWLHEGLATYNEPDMTYRVEHVMEAAEANELLPFSHMQGNFGAHNPTVNLAYAQSGMLVAHLMEDCGTSGFRQFIQGLQEQMTIDEAMEAACGYDSQELYDSWRQTLPNSPVPGGQEEGEVAAVPTPVTEPQGESDRSRSDVAPEPPRGLLLLLVAGLCVVALLSLAIIAIVIHLLRSRSSIT